MTRWLPLPGTTSILVGPGGELAFGRAAPLDDPLLLGFVEQAPLPLLDQLSTGRLPQTGQRVLIAGASDPVAGALEDVVPVGFIEPYPIHPKQAPHIEAQLIGLVRTVDRDARRHRYGAGQVPRGVLAGELGALLRYSRGECDPLWVNDQGFVFPAGRLLTNGRPSVATALRWIGEPLTWSNFSGLSPKLRASGRRAYDSTRFLSSPPVHPERPLAPAGYLLRSPNPYTVPLYGARHPVTNDQLLSTNRSEAVSLGYRDIELLGHLVAHAPVTGQLGPTRPPAPWASRFGVLTDIS